MTNRSFAYYRLYADGDGESHIEDVTLPMQSVAYAPPAPPLDHLSLGDAAGITIIAGDNSWEGRVFHPAPARQFMFVLRGRGSVRCSDGASRNFASGDVLLLEDTSGKGHATELFDECVIAAVRVGGS